MPGPGEKTYKEYALEVAKDFHYDEIYISKIQRAKTDAEISSILATARHEKFKED